MDLSDVYRRARLEAKRRIAWKEITQSELARQAGLSQPILSAYLKDNENGGPSKNLSDERRDTLMQAMGLSLEDFVPQQRPSALHDSRPIFQVSQRTAIRRRFIPGNLHESNTGITYFAAEKDARTDLSDRVGLERFVAIRATGDHAIFMRPAIEEEFTLVIDRYDTQLQLSPPDRRTIYAVSVGDELKIGYLKVIGNQLQLLPDANQEDPLLISLGFQRDQSHIVGTIVIIVRHTLNRPGTKNPTP